MRAQVQGFHIREKSYRPEEELPLHAHDRACLCLVLRGEVHHRDGETERTYGPLDVVYTPASHPHANSIGRAGAEILALEIDPQLVDSLREEGFELDAAVHRHPPGVAGIGARIRSELQAGDAASRLLLQGLSLELLGTACRREDATPKGAPPRWLIGVRERVEAEFRGRLPLRDLAASAGVHPVHLAQSFRAHFGETVGAMQRRLRVEAASRELIESRDSLLDVALSVGFYDQSHFTRWFKRSTGLSPGAYRRQFQE